VLSGGGSGFESILAVEFGRLAQLADVPYVRSLTDPRITAPREEPTHRWLPR
jgi:hypothetical protein